MIKINNPLVSLIIVDYKNSTYLKPCLESLKKQSYKNFEVIVVINSCSDHFNHDFLQKISLNLKVICNKENFGFAKANNQAIKISKGEYVITLNNDTIVDKDFIKEMVRCSQETNSDMVSSRMLFMDNPDYINSRGIAVYKNGVFRDLDFMEKNSEKFDFREEVIGPSAGAALYSKKMLKKIGLFDEDFFMYFEDVDLALRARLKGYKCFYEPSAIVHHKFHGQSNIKLSSFYGIRNFFWIIIKDFPIRLFFSTSLKTLFRYIASASKVLLYRVSFRNQNNFSNQLEIPSITINLKTLFYSLMGFPSMFKKRFQIKPRRKAFYENIDKFILIDYTPKVKSKEFVNKNSFLFGINIMGFLDSESGIGEASRSVVRVIKKTNFSFVLNNNIYHNSRRKDSNLTEEFKNSNPYSINLVAVNGDSFFEAINYFGTDYFKYKYVIVYWVWELSDIPKSWIKLIPYIDEFWVPTEFVANAIRKETNKPILKVPYNLNLELKTSDSVFVDKKKFTFLFIFDFYSLFERKNPLALIGAFKKAFSKNEPVELIIKCSNSKFDIQNLKKMNVDAKGYSIKIINDYLLRDEINSLMNSVDCYVSLHRSEGFGLTIAESMAFGKPVIATNYSGNVDFLNKTNGYPVDYKLVKIKKNYGPYKKGQLWAEPNINHASKLMRYVFENKEDAKRIGLKASKDIREYLDAKRIAKDVEVRLNELFKNEKI